MEKINKNDIMAATFGIVPGVGEVKSGKSEVEVAGLKNVNLDELHTFHTGEHPFLVKDDEEMEKLRESIKSVGVLVPAILRPDSEATGEYEILSGHRRRRAALLEGVEQIPAVVRNYTDDEAIVIMCDSNLQREKLLPSEKAKAYRMKYEALKRQGKRTDLGEDATSDQVGPKLRTDQELAKESKDSATNIKRYIRLTYLVDELMEMVDEKKLKFNIGVTLSYLKREEQEALVDVIDCDGVKPSLEQAEELKKMSKEGKRLDSDLIHVFLKKETVIKSKLNESYINKHLPDAVKKMPVEKKMSYTEKALKHYNQYVEAHPEELNEL